MKVNRTFIVLAILLLYVVLSVTFVFVQSSLVGASFEDGAPSQPALRSLSKGVLTQPIVAVLSASDNYAQSANNLRRECPNQNKLSVIILVSISIAFFVSIAMVFTAQYFDLSVLAYFSGGISPPFSLI